MTDAYEIEEWTPGHEDMGPRAMIRPWYNADTGSLKYRAVIVESWPGNVTTIQTCPHSHHSPGTAATCAEGGLSMSRRHGHPIAGWT